MGLCAPLVVTDNLDLAFVTDIDIVTYTPLCAQIVLGFCGCCMRSCIETYVATGQVSISSLEGIKHVHLHQAAAKSFAEKLFGSVEEAHLRYVSERALWSSALS